MTSSGNKINQSIIQRQPADHALSLSSHVACRGEFTNGTLWAADGTERELSGNEFISHPATNGIKTTEGGGCGRRRSDPVGV